MTLDELIDFASFGLSVNDSQFNDAIAPDRWKQLVQMAYKNVWSRFRTIAPRSALLTYIDKTWTAGSFTYSLPIDLRNALIYDILYVDSNGNPFDRVGAYFESKNVLRLGVGSGLSTDFQMRFYYIPEVELLTGGSSPLLILPQHHEAVAWEALKVVKMLADKEVPEGWLTNLESLEYQMFNEAKSRPLASRPNVISVDAPMIRPYA